MEYIIPNLEALQDVAKTFAYCLPIVWSSMIMVEWFTQLAYCAKYHIDHSFSLDYKIIFDPRYALSLIFALVAMSLSCLCAKFLGSHVLYTFIVIMFCLVVVCFICSVIFKTKLKKLYLDEKNNVVDEYRKTKKVSALITFVEKVFLGIVIIWSIGSVIVCPEAKDFLMKDERFVQAFGDSSDVLKEIGGLYTVAYLFWLIASSALMHWAVKLYADSQTLGEDEFRYFRVIVNEQMTYAILSPTFSSRNGTCIAVRTIICRKKNGIFVGNLILDKVITQKAPYEGESFLVGIDKVNCMLPNEYQSAFLSNNEIKQQLIKENMNEYLKCDRKWHPLIDAK